MPLLEKAMAKRRGYEFVSESNRFIFSDVIKERYRMRSTDLTRSRKLPFEQLVLCMLKLLRRSLQLELDSFFKAIGSGVQSITASGFIQSRRKLSPDLFYDLNVLIASEYYKDNDENVTLWKGHRILAVDGSTVELPVNEGMKTVYGTHNNQHKIDDVVIGRVSVLYDVLNNIVLDGLLRPIAQGEVTLSREHLKHTSRGDLIIMDRVYPCFESAYQMQKDGIDFLFRCKTDFSNVVKAFHLSGAQEQMVRIRPTQNRSFKHRPYSKDTTLKVRLIRVELDQGGVEILMSSLLDQEKYPYAAFKELYFKRWKIETFYDRFKNIIGVECFSGTSEQFIQQEFNCALYMSNMQTIFTQEAQQLVDEKCKDRKYEYRVNSSLSLGYIRERLIDIYSTRKEPGQLMQELQELFIRNPIPIRPGRKNKREPDKYRQRTKPKQFNNRRNVL
jgi:hypothetical protein